MSNLYNYKTVIIIITIYNFINTICNLLSTIFVILYLTLDTAFLVSAYIFVELIKKLVFLYSCQNIDLPAQCLADPCLESSNTPEKVLIWCECVRVSIVTLAEVPLVANAGVEVERCLRADATKAAPAMVHCCPQPQGVLPVRAPPYRAPKPRSGANVVVGESATSAGPEDAVNLPHGSGVVAGEVHGGCSDV